MKKNVSTEIKNLKEKLVEDSEAIESLEFIEKEYLKLTKNQKVIALIKKYGFAHCEKAMIYCKKFSYSLYKKAFVVDVMSEKDFNLLKENF